MNSYVVFLSFDRKVARLLSFDKYMFMFAYLCVLLLVEQDRMKNIL
jgi:hypothetical protein